MKEPTMLEMYKKLSKPWEKITRTRSILWQGTIKSWL